MKALPLADPRATLRPARDELIRAFEAVLDGGQYILGEHVAAFERDWSTFCGVDHAVGLSSGTDALALALRAVGVSAGDEVLVPAMTAVATWMAVSQIGAIPIGVDIEPRLNGMDPDSAHAALGPRTRALVVVHLYGQPAELDSLLEVSKVAGLPLIEDAAQAHGARFGGKTVGSIGVMGTFSFYPTKNLGAIGDAGAVTTCAPELADSVRALREYGWHTRADATHKGINARLDELQAALLRVMLTRLRDATERRREIAAAYLAGLAGAAELELPESRIGSEPVWHLFVVRHPRRDALAAALGRAGITTAVHYTPPPALNSAFRADGWREGSLPVAERHAETALSLPMYPALTNEEVNRVIETVQIACQTI